MSSISNIARLLRKRNAELIVANQSIQDIPQELRSSLTNEQDVSIYKEEFNIKDSGEIYALQKGKTEIEHERGCSG